MVSQVAAKLPHLSRFTRYCYAQTARFVVMHKGVVVAELDSVFGSQQGDPLGGHFFALSVYDFMRELRDAFQSESISWIVDDLTVSGTQGRLTEVAKFIEEKGPAYELRVEVLGIEEHYPPVQVRRDAAPTLGSQAATHIGPHI